MTKAMKRTLYVCNNAATCPKNIDCYHATPHFPHVLDTLGGRDCSQILTECPLASQVACTCVPEEQIAHSEDDLTIDLEKELSDEDWIEGLNNLSQRSTAPAESRPVTKKMMEAVFGPKQEV